MRNREQLLAVAEPWRARRRSALELAERVLQALDPYEATRESLRVVFPHGNAHGDIHVLALGKAAPAMARAALCELGVKSGVVLSLEPPSRDLEPLLQLTGSHPSPCPNAPAHARQIIGTLQALSPTDQLVCLISGGGSALLELPRDGLSLDDLSQTSQLLMHAGASVQVLNVVRRALSQVKGGGLLRACTANVTNFILSDVVGGPIYAVASGPTLPVNEPTQAPLALLEHFGVRNAAPASVIALLEAAASDAHPSCGSSERDPATERRVSPPNPDILPVTPATWLIADNDHAVRLLQRHASALGHQLQVPPGHLQGDAARAGEQLLEYVSRRPVAGLAWGGETTVRVDTSRPGRGGRNQELILGAARCALRRGGGFEGTLVSFGSDGIDGQSPAAGALLDAAVLARLDTPGVDRALAAHDSFGLLDSVDSTLITGPTGTNVADLVFWLP